MKNIIFDVDGTLWDSTEIVAKAWRQAILESGASKAVVTPELLKQEFGKPMNIIGEDILTDIPEETEREKILDCCCVYEQKLLTEMEQDITYPGVKKGIRELSETYRLYIVSNCQCGYIELFLEKNGLASYIQDFECFGNTGTGKGETIKLLMKRNGLEKQDSIYIGDTQGDHLAAKEAGIRFLFAEYGFGSTENPDGVTGSFPGIPEAVQKLFGE